MKLHWMMVALVVGGMAVSGCKKDKKTDDPAGGGTAAAGSSMAGTGAAGGSAAGSAMANPTEGSGGGTMAGSAGSAAGSAATVSMTDAEIEKLITDGIAMFAEIGKAVAGKDCAGAAAGINATLDKHKDFVAKFTAVSDDDAIEDRAEKIMEAKGLEKQIEDAFKPVEEASEKCESDPGFQAAGERLKEVLK